MDDPGARLEKQFLTRALGVGGLRPFALNGLQTVAEGLGLPAGKAPVGEEGEWDVFVEMQSLF